jgi:hypothetical protein
MATCTREGFPDLVTRWRRDAETLRSRGASAQAVAIESCATDLEQAVVEFSAETLTLEHAVEESGYSYSALQRMVATGRLPNAGSSHRPRIRRANLPRKPARCSPVDGEEGEPDLAELVLAGAG